MKRFKQIKRDKLAVVAIIFLTLLMLGTIFADWIAPYDPNQQDILHKLSPPSGSHFFGTDQLGRDIFSRILYGGRVTISLAIVIVLLILLAGLLFGSLAGLIGGWFDRLVMLSCDLLLSLPGEMMSLCIIGILGPSTLTIILALTIIRWPWYIKMIRAEILNYQTKNYVIFSKSSGKSTWWIFKHHFLRPLGRSLLVYSTLDISTVVMSISALSFLGIGIQPPTAEWGSMLNESKEIAVIQPWQMFPAGVTLFLVVAMLNYFGDSLSDVMQQTNS